MADKFSYQNTDMANAKGVGTKKLSENTPSPAISAPINDGGNSGKGKKKLPLTEGTR